MSTELFYKIKKIRKAFTVGSPIDLKKLSNRLIEEAAVSNDPIIAELSMITYSLYKVVTKAHYKGNPKWEKTKLVILDAMDASMSHAKKKNLALVEKSIHKIIFNIEKVDSSLGHFVSGIYYKAQVKQASRAYSMGLSLSQASALTKCDKERLQDYIGSTTMHDEMKVVFGIKERLSNIKRVLKSDSE